MNMVELNAETGTTPRQIRYLIVNGLMPAPTGGRAHADYGSDHVQAVRRYKEMRTLGLSLHEIRKISSSLADREPTKARAPSDGVAILARRSRTLALLAIDRLTRDRPSLRLRHGDIGLDKCVEDMIWHIAHLRSATAFDCPGLFGAYTKWVMELFNELSIDPAEFFHALIALRDILLEELERESRAMPLAILNDAIQNFPGLEASRAAPLDLAAPHGSLAAMFLDALLSTRWNDTAALARRFLDEGLSHTDIQVHVIQPALREVGRLWHIRRIGVEHEHMATAISLGVLSQLKDSSRAPPAHAPILVAACVGGELHDIGLRMIAERYEREGWLVHYLGANTPIGAIVAATIESGANTVALSATMTPHLDQVARAIEAIRADTRSRATSILVGGLPFIVAPDIWRKIGADASATDVASVPLGWPPLTAPPGRSRIDVPEQAPPIVGARELASLNAMAPVGTTSAGTTKRR